MNKKTENQPLPNQVSESDLLYWRDRILNSLYIAGVSLGVPIVVVAVYLLMQKGRWEIALMEIIYILTGVLMVIFRRRIPYTPRAVTFLAMIYSLGLLILFRMGPFSGGPVWIFTFAALAGILMGLHAAALALIVNLGTLAAMGWIIVDNLAPWAGDYSDKFGQLALAGLSFILLNTLVAVSMAVLTRNLQSSVQKEKHAAQVLANERSELQREVEERKRLHRLLLIQNNLSERLGACQDLEAALGHALDAALQVDDVDAGAVYLRQENGDTLQMIHHMGFGDTLAEQMQTYACSSLTAPNRISVHWRDALSARGFKAAVFSPAINEECPAVGLLALSGVRDAFTSNAMSVIETIAAQMRDAAVRIQAEKELEENRVKFQTAFRAAPGAITINRLSDGRYIDVNPNATDMYGYTRDEFLGHTSFELNIWADRPEQAHRRNAIIEAEGIVRGFEFTFRRKNGDIGTGLNYAEIIDLNGEPHLLSLSIDISERKRTVEALKESEERFRSAFVHAALGMAVVATNGDFLAVNPYFCEMLGYTEKELLTRSFRDINHPDDVERTSMMHRKLVAGEITHVWLEKKYLTKDKQVIWGLASSALVRGAQGQPLYIISHIQNVSERKQYELALQQSEQRYRTVVENVPCGLCVAELATGRFLFLNQKILDMFGYTREHAMQLTFWDSIHPLERELAARRIAARLQNHEQKMDSQRYTGVRQDGTTFRFEIDLSLITHEGEQAVQGILQDVTNVEMLERQLAQAQKLEAMGTLTSGIAHDFNNILQSISGYIQLMKRLTEPGTPFKNYLEETDRISSRAAELVDRLLTFSRRIEPELKPLDVNQTVRHMVQTLVRTLPENIEISTLLADDARLIDADAGLIDQVLLNLCANARDAMPDGGKLTIETANVFLDSEQSQAYINVMPGDHVQLTVSDTGTGIDPETLKRLFEPFFTTKLFGKGTGLGLSIAYSIVQTHRGAITCESQVGRGASFRILLPASASTAPEAIEPAVSDAEPEGGPETVLLVDDERSILETGAEILSMKGYHILTASSGEEALEKYRQNPNGIDLVILDLGMPGMGGQQCLDRILNLNPRAKVLIASGYSIGTKAEEVLRQGAAGFISKPYRLDNLLKTTRDVLDRSVD